MTELGPAAARHAAPAAAAGPSLATPVFDAHAHLDAMAQRAGAPADDAFVARVMREARAVGVVAAVTVGDSPIPSSVLAGSQPTSRVRPGLPPRLSSSPSTASGAIP